MKYTVAYLEKQLEDARKLRDVHLSRLAANPEDIATELVADSMTAHVKEIEHDLETARREEARLRASEGRLLPPKTAKKPARVLVAT